MRKLIDKTRAMLYRKKISKHFPRVTENDIFIHPASSLSEHVDIGYGTRITGPALIKSGKSAPCIIGKYCAIGENLIIVTQNHYTGYANLQVHFQMKYNLPLLMTDKGSVIIGNNTWIGDNVTILPGGGVGDGAVLGAGSVLTATIPPYTIAVGNPARVVKKRFSDNIIEQLLNIQWWDWTPEKIQRNKRFFETDLRKHPDLDLSTILCD
ncbi:MAG: CatB-related O-acetyltransferase [Thermodesulfobacteriota bacterium]|nr:CatB-related O-acetyltransferase [Thermodesulfobacteriota bacterium]